MNKSDIPKTLHLGRFGVFELDFQTGELRKSGVRIKLADQPFRILAALMEQPGELVTREQLIDRIWHGETAGDFEQGLNRAVSKLRDALSDRAVNPRFIETLPGRGYRFIAEIQGQQVEAEKPRPQRRFVLLASATLLLASVVGGAVKMLMPAPVATLRWRKLTTDSYIKNPPALTDGSRLYFAASFEGEQFIAQVPVTGGHPARLPITPPGPAFILQDLSLDGQEFLLTAAARLDRVRFMPLWTLRIADGSARRLGSIVATSAAYAPSGNMIAYSTPTEIWIARSDGSEPRRLVEMKESFTGSICWSNDGAWIRFSRRDPLSNFASPWEIKADGSGLRNVIPDSGGISLTPAGWALDGRLAIFSGGGFFWARPEGWSLFEKRRAIGRLAEDAPEFDGFIRVRSPNVFPAVGTDRLGELQSYSESSKTWTPLVEGISAEAVEYSPDGLRIAYITYPQRTLWVRQADGKRPIQLTSQPLVAAFPRWSPDGKRIAFSAGEPDDRPMRLYLVDADGGQIKPAVPSAAGSQGYPTWSPDGKKLLYGIVNTSFREDAYIRVADLETGKVTKLAGSEGLFAPRWAPDGRTVAALRFMGDRKLMLFDVKDERWEEARGHFVDWPVWTPDSKSILCRSGDLIVRYRLAARQFETIAKVQPEELGGYSRGIGTTFNGSPVRTLNRDSRQIYSLQLGGGL